MCARAHSSAHAPEGGGPASAAAAVACDVALRLTDPERVHAAIHSAADRTHFPRSVHWLPSGRRARRCRPRAYVRAAASLLSGRGLGRCRTATAHIGAVLDPGPNAPRKPPRGIEQRARLRRAVDRGRRFAARAAFRVDRRCDRSGGSGARAGAPPPDPGRCGQRVRRHLRAGGIGAYLLPRRVERLPTVPWPHSSKPSWTSSAAPRSRAGMAHAGEAARRREYGAEVPARRPELRVGPRIPGPSR